VGLILPYLVGNEVMIYLILIKKYKVIIPYNYTLTLISPITSLNNPFFHRIFAYTELTKLKLNLFSKELLAITQLTNLQELTISADLKESIIIKIGKCTSLRSLTLDKCRGIVLSHLSNLTSLTYCNLGNSSSSSISDLRRMSPTLTTLGIARIDLDSYNITAFEIFTSLTCLDISYSNINENALHQIGKITTLTRLKMNNLNFRELGKFTHDGSLKNLDFLKSLVGLTSLSISFSRIQDKELIKLYHLPLTALNLAHCNHLSNKVLDYLTHCSFLSILSLKNCRICGGMSNLTSLSNLTQLDVGECILSDTDKGIINSLLYLNLDRKSNSTEPIAYFATL
jgi:Leucine-rich repeat (LRR) protein